MAVQTQMEFEYFCSLQSLSEKVLFRAWETTGFVLRSREKSELISIKQMRYSYIKIFGMVEYPNGKQY